MSYPGVETEYLVHESSWKIRAQALHQACSRDPEDNNFLPTTLNETQTANKVCPSYKGVKVQTVDP